MQPPLPLSSRLCSVCLCLKVLQHLSLKSTVFSSGRGKMWKSPPASVCSLPQPLHRRALGAHVLSVRTPGLLVSVDSSRSHPHPAAAPWGLGQERLRRAGLRPALRAIFLKWTRLSQRPPHVTRGRPSARREKFRLLSRLRASRPCPAELAPPGPQLSSSLCRRGG